MNRPLNVIRVWDKNHENEVLISVDVEFEIASISVYNIRSLLNFDLQRKRCIFYRVAADCIEEKTVKRFYSNIVRDYARELLSNKVSDSSVDLQKYVSSELGIDIDFDEIEEVIYMELS